MPLSTDNDWVVRTVPPEDARPALQWLNYGAVPIDPTAEVANSGGVFEILHEGNRIGAVWIVVQPGRTATMHGPRIDCQDADSVRSRLMQCAERYLEENDVRVTQRPLADDQAEIPLWLARAGYQHRVEIDFLVRPHHQNADRCDPDRHDHDCRGLVQFETCTEATRDRLVSVVERTYRQSLDCPILDQARSIDDILTGYRAIGRLRPGDWRLVCYDGRDVGCLLMADHPCRDESEIVYLGITPEMRGRGFGQAVTHAAIAWSVSQGRSRVLVAVDVTNGPAQAMYSDAGFFRWDHRCVALRIGPGMV